MDWAGTHTKLDLVCPNLSCLHLTLPVPAKEGVRQGHASISSENGGRGAFQKLGDERFQKLLKKWKTPVPPQRKKIGIWLEFCYFHTCPGAALASLSIIESRRCWGPFSRSYSAHSPASSPFPRTCQNKDEGNSPRALGSVPSYSPAVSSSLEA